MGNTPLGTKRVAEATDSLHPTRLPAAICYRLQVTMMMGRLWERALRSHLLPRRQKTTPGINM